MQRTSWSVTVACLGTLQQGPKDAEPRVALDRRAAARRFEYRDRNVFGQEGDVRIQDSRDRE